MALPIIEKSGNLVFRHQMVERKMVFAIVEKVERNVIIWQGKSERSDWFFLGRDFTIRTVSTETVQAVYFF